jgi:hypothetical protein
MSEPIVWRWTHPDDTLEGLKVAILVTDDFHQVQLLEPGKAVDQAAAETSVVPPERDGVRGWTATDWGCGAPMGVVRLTGDALQATFKGPTGQSDTVRCTLSAGRRVMTGSGVLYDENGRTALRGRL